MFKNLHILQSIITAAFILMVSTAAFAVLEIGNEDISISYDPHHADPGNPGHPGTPGHYMGSTGDDHHYLWADQIPATSVIDIYYDFRAAGVYDNSANAEQIARGNDAFDLWSSVSNINFIQNTGAAASDIICFGTGDLAALGSSSAPGGTLGLGGGGLTHGGQHSISMAIAWMDFAETWDDIIGNGNPGGTFDYFTVAVQEVGHALGLGHVDDLSGSNMMDGIYGGEQIILSNHDIDHIISLYGADPDFTSIEDGINADFDLGYTNQEISSLLQLYSDGKNAEDPADIEINGIKWRYYDTLPDQEHQISGTTYEFEGMKYIYLGSGLGEVPEVPSGATLLLTMLYTILTRSRRNKKIKSPAYQALS